MVAVALNKGVWIGPQSNPVVLAPGRTPRVVDEHTRSFLSALAQHGALEAANDEDTAVSLQLLVDCGFVTAAGVTPHVGGTRTTYSPTLTDLTLKRPVPALGRIVRLLSLAVGPATTSTGVVIGLTLLAVSTVYVMLIAPVSASLSPLIDQPAVMIIGLFTWNLVRALPHEAGHFAVARRAGYIPNAGMGLYLYGPVLYVDLTCMELEPRQVRVRADLAGASVDGWLCAALLAAAVATGEPWLHAVLLTDCAVALANLRPTEKYDGFWALRDILNARGMSATWASPQRLLEFVLRGSPAEKRFSRALVGVYTVSVLWMIVVAPRWVRESLSELAQRPAEVLFAATIAVCYLGITICSVALLRRRIARTACHGKGSANHGRILGG